MFGNNNQSSMFTNSSSNANDQDMAIESKFQTRQEAFLNEENFSTLKENEMSKELSLGQNMRNLKVNLLRFVGMSGLQRLCRR